MQLEAKEPLQQIMFARYYGAGLARFLSPDPAGLKLDRLVDPQRLNLFGYAANNPLKYIDPDGQDIELAKTGDWRTMKSFLVQTAMRPSGRGRGVPRI